MEQLVIGVLLTFFALLTTATSTQSEAQVYRFTVRDIFKNPEYSSYSECGVRTCTKYKAKCLEDGNCCLCRCNARFSTYNVSEARCVLDETLLSASALRLLRNDKLQRNIPIISLTKRKTLGRIVTIKGNYTRPKKCKLVTNDSYYWSDSLRGGWKLLLDWSKDSRFKIRNLKNAVTLQWISTNTTEISWFHGRVFYLSIQCAEITSNIIFKSQKNYNENNFFGCLNPDNATAFATAALQSFTCSKMTPKMCKDFCRRQGHSVAMLNKRNKCVCAEYSKVASWTKARFSCSIPCAGDSGKFCGGKKSYSAYQAMPEWPHDFKFSSNGTLNSLKYRCTEIKKPNPLISWNNSNFCAKKVGPNIKLSWFSEQPRKRIISNRRCIAIHGTTNSSSWKDNYLCLSKDVGLKFMWSHSGPDYGIECLRMQAEVSIGWEDNYLCADRPGNGKTVVSTLCPDKTTPPPNDPTAATPFLTSMSHTLQTNRPIDPISKEPITTNTSSTETLSTDPVSTDTRPTHTYTLPHSTEYFPSHSTIFNTTSKEGPKDENKDDKHENFTPLYIFVTSASILSALSVGVFVFLYLKKRIKGLQRCNSSAQITDFDNPAWQNDKGTLNREMGVIEQKSSASYKRKSRIDKLPSLPGLSDETYPPQNPIITSPNTPPKPNNTPPGEILHTPAETQNAAYILPANEACKTLETESRDVYAVIPVQSVNECDIENQHYPDHKNVNNNDNSSGLGNPTYESIDNFSQPDCIYLEVLP